MSARAGASGSPSGGGDPLDDRVEHLVDVDARLGGDAHDVGRIAAEQLRHLDGAAPSGSAEGRSILFTTGTISSSFSIAR